VEAAALPCALYSPACSACNVCSAAVARVGAVGLLTLPQPFDFALSTERFRVFGPDRANLWYEGGLHRVIDGREVRIESAAGGVEVEPLNASTEPVVRKLLGAEFELDPFYRWARRDAVLRRLVRRLAGFRPPLAPDPFETLVTSVTAQQVSLFAAFAIRNRLIERFGRRAEHAYAFPTRERIAGAHERELTELGFSARKAEYVISLARSELDFVSLAALDDQQIKVTLVAQRGIGEWTADWYLARHLARPRAWPAGDLGLRKAVSAFYFDGQTLSTAEVRGFGDRLEPFQNLGAHYLLTGLRVAAA
jgi:DNA-3-methyladenine glycosylase II